ncbi:MAG: hypothetical protein IJX88_05230 [Clostridia bacterium]|nr:hypothetical protein [Clostridia bacterium]
MEKAIVYILFGAVGVIIGLLFPKVKSLYMIGKYCKGVHHCNVCEVSFLESEELNYMYCPFCGRKLTLYKDDARYTNQEETSKEK